MCGICGSIGLQGQPAERAAIERMCAALVHRGPDAQGVQIIGEAGLGQRRLSIIDLDPRSTAPLANEDGTVWVTFNGEIYNFRELRERLRDRGHRFRTESDTEVLVHLYEEHGAACVHELRGMFAFAIWDARRRRLFAARDRLGKKPFYYTQDANGFRFASELQALVRQPGFDRTPDYAAIDAYLRWQYVPSPLTAFAGVRKLPAGHTLSLGPDAELRVERYWRPPTPAPLTGPVAAIEEELVARLREAVRVRLVSDVPLGAFLSGGIDSGAVVALMAQETGRPVQTFSIGLEGNADDERPYARLVAERYGTEHHEFVIRPDAAALLPELVRHYGEPFADSSAVPTYYLARETRRHVTVALSGDGGDESFAGYDTYASVLRWGRADVLPRPLRAALAAGVGGAAEAMPYGNLSARVARAAALFAGTAAERYRLQMMTFKPQERDAAYTDDFRARLVAALGERGSHGRADSPAGATELDWMMREDQATYLPDALMVKVDIASMANSLEVRSPFLDHEFMAFAASIPAGLKRARGPGKLILRSALHGLLPEPVLHKRKTGFGIPVAHWLRNDLRALMQGALLDERAAARGLFRRAFVSRIVAEHVAGRRDWSNRLWALLCLELWFREFVD